MREIPIDTKVECADGPCGKSLAVIIDRETREVTHIAIEDKSLAHAPYQRLVPVDLVEDTGPDLIRLSCTRKDLDRTEAFIHTHYVARKEQDWTMYQAGEGAGRGSWSRPSRVGEAATRIDEEYVPEGELAVHPGLHVEATNGRIGIVEELIVDPTSERVTHIVLEEGHFWGKKEVMIPISALDHSEGDTVYLNLDKAAVEKLPTLPRKRH